MDIEKKYNYLIDYFEKHLPVVQTELKYNNSYELTVAVILSAQCTDKRVNLITPLFFQKFPNITTLAQASIDEIYQYIKSCSYPNNKAKHLKAMAEMVKKKYNGILPKDPEEMQKIPGIGRKTAHVLASVLFNKPVIAVDTHVFRVSKRIGLVQNAKTPLECEKQLTKHFPAHVLHNAHHWLIIHGRYICKARKPSCNECELQTICNYYNQIN